MSCFGTLGFYHRRSTGTVLYYTALYGRTVHFCSQFVRCIWHWNDRPRCLYYGTVVRRGNLQVETLFRVVPQVYQAVIAVRVRVRSRDISSTVSQK